MSVPSNNETLVSKEITQNGEGILISSLMTNNGEGKDGISKESTLKVSVPQPVLQDDKYIEITQNGYNNILPDYGNEAIKCVSLNVNVPVPVLEELYNFEIDLNGYYYISSLMTDTVNNDGITKNSRIYVNVPEIRLGELRNKYIYNNGTYTIASLMEYDGEGKEGITKDSSIIVSTPQNIVEEIDDVNITTNGLYRVSEFMEDLNHAGISKYSRFNINITAPSMYPFYFSSMYFFETAGGYPRVDCNEIVQYNKDMPVVFNYRSVICFFEYERDIYDYQWYLLVYCFYNNINPDDYDGEYTSDQYSYIPHLNPDYRRDVFIPVKNGSVWQPNFTNDYDEFNVSFYNGTVYNSINVKPVLLSDYLKRKRYYDDSFYTLKLDRSCYKMFESDVFN